MTLQSSGAISLLDVQGEFGGSIPIGLNEYYGAASGVPASGTISLADFYGASACDTTTAPTLINTYNVTTTANPNYGRWVNITSSKYYFSFIPFQATAYVYIRNHDDSGEISVTNPVTPSIDDSFGVIAVDESTNTMVVGAPNADAAGSNSGGTAYWFNATTGAYLNITKSTTYGGWSVWGQGIQGPQWGDRIFAENNKFFICCTKDRCGTSTTYGSIWVYNSSGTLLTNKLGTSGTSSTPGNAYGLGLTIDDLADGKIICTSSYSATAGVVNIYDYNLNHLYQWNKPAGTPQFWGAATSIGQGVIAIGAPDHAFSGAGGVLGKVYLYDYNYNLITTINSPTNNSGFGDVIRIRNGRIMIADIRYNSNIGRVYIYNLNGVLLSTIDDPNPATSGQFSSPFDYMQSKYNLMFMGRGQSGGAGSTGYFYKYSTPENSGCSGP